MQDENLETVPDRQDTQTTASLGWQAIRFLLHLAAVYLVAAFVPEHIAGWTYRNLFPALQIHTNRSSFEFFYTHLLFFSFVPAFLTGLLNARFKHRVAEFVWIVPAIVLLYKLVTFSTTGSVLAQTYSWPAFHQYFGGGFLIPESHNWTQFVDLLSNPDMIRGVTQRLYTAPFYAGIAYSLASTLGRRIPSLQSSLQRLRQSESSASTVPI